MSAGKSSRGRTVRIGAVCVVLLGLTLLLAACGEEDSASSGVDFAVEASHVHGLGVNPADGSLFIATHGGLFRAEPGSEAPSRIGKAGYDLMGFTVAGPDRFLASGHPPLDEADSPHLGLVESSDGESWEEVSLGGRADFHVLRYSGGAIYGFNGLDGRLMVSTDEGTSWSSEQVPAPLFDLAVDPQDPTHIVAATEGGLFEAVSGGEKWKQIEGRLGLLAWPEPTSLFLVDGEGRVSVSEDGGQSWRSRGALPQTPVVLYAVSATELYAAMPEGAVLRSSDGGRSWTPRVQP
jgi:hypothetical protein